MARRTYACANWCTVATWASKQAGATIRGEDRHNALVPGPPPDGQAYLKAAFGCYQAQGTVQDPVQRGQLIVLANLQIGLHEQTRLQPQILAAMDSAVTGLETGLALRIRDKLLQRQLMELSRLVITRAMMMLTLLGTALSLADNITRP